MDYYVEEESTMGQGFVTWVHVERGRQLGQSPDGTVAREPRV